MKEYSFDEAERMLREGKCKGITFKSWGYPEYDSRLYLDGNILMCTFDNGIYDKNTYNNWRDFGWTLVEPNFKEDNEVKQKRCIKETKMITQYIYKNRNGNRAKVGMLVAFNDDLDVKFGYSLCSKEDTFNKDKAFSIAEGRACKGTGYDYPPSLKKDVEAFKNRVVRYFKDCSHKIK